jgi:hypothetical protein
MVKKHMKNFSTWTKSKCKSKPGYDSTSLLLESTTQTTTNIGEDVGGRTPNTLLVGM